METRFISTAEVRSIGNRKIGGLAAPYGSRAKLKHFQETIAPGAFDRILRSNPDTVCLFNHNPDNVMGRTSSGTLRLFADGRGLNYECDLPNTQAARDLHESIQRGDIAGNSFGFLLGDGDDEWSEDYDEDRSKGRVILRTIRNFKTLQDVSPVTHPAYSGTELSARCEHIPAEVRSQLQRLGAKVPATVPSDFELLRDQLREVTYWENKLNAPKVIVARRRNLLSQV